MEEPPETPPEYHLEVFADRTCVKGIVKAVLHLILFHRYFTPLTPSTHDLLDITLPYVADVEIETQIDERVGLLLRQFETPTPTPAYRPSAPYTVQAQQLEGGRGQVVVNFLEKKRKKSWFGARADTDTVWETWIIDVSLATPRSEAEAQEARKAMEACLRGTAMTIVNTVNRDRNHIPPIVTNESNPFPHQILVNPKR